MLDGRLGGATFDPNVFRPNRVLTPLKSASKAAVGNQSHFFRQSPFRTFRQKCQPQIHIEVFVEMFEMEIVEKRGLVARATCTYEMCDV
jgi:hypothetical protein